MNIRFLSFSLLCLALIVQPLQTAAADPRSTGGTGTVIAIDGDYIIIQVRLELWGDGIWNNPDLAKEWEQGVEQIWNDGGQTTKYKCYEIHFDLKTKISSPERPDGSAKYGTPGWHQIWVPDVLIGDMANTYNDFGLYVDPEDGLAYGDLDPTKAQELYTDGGGRTLAGVVPRGYYLGNQPANWGTIPNSVEINTVAHEVGHLMGLMGTTAHDQGWCGDNLMYAYGGEVIYPVYWETILANSNLVCQWNVRTDINMTTSSGNYTPLGLKAHIETQLTEKQSMFGAVADGEGTITYDDITKEFHGDEFGWVPHNGTIYQQSELLYNIREDLKTGGRMIMTSSLLQSPYEELTYIIGPFHPDPNEVGVRHHTNVEFALTGQSLQVKPYDHHYEEFCSPNPKKTETTQTEQFYKDKVVIEGASANASAEHFPNSHLYNAEFDYDVQVTAANPL